MTRRKKQEEESGFTVIPMDAFTNQAAEVAKTDESIPPFDRNALSMSSLAAATKAVKRQAAIDFQAKHMDQFTTLELDLEDLEDDRKFLRSQLELGRTDLAKAKKYISGKALRRRQREKLNES